MRAWAESSGAARRRQERRFTCPYESYLPQAPLETNRVEYAGFWIVRPAGWTTHPIAINDFLTNDLTAQLAIERKTTNTSRVSTSSVWGLMQIKCIVIG